MNTETLETAIIRALSDPRAESTRDLMRTICELGDTIDEMRALQDRGTSLTDTCNDLTQEIIDDRVSDIRDEAKGIAGHIIAELSEIEVESVRDFRFYLDAQTDGCVVAVHENGECLCATYNRANSPVSWHEQPDDLGEAISHVKARTIHPRLFEKIEDNHLNGIT